MTRSRRDREVRDRRAALGASAVAALLALVATTSSLAAQVPAATGRSEVDPSRSIDVTAFFGWISPLSNLTEDPASFDTTISPYIAVGADAVYWLSRNLGVGVTGLWVPADLQIRPTEFQGAVPSDLGDVTYLSALANVVYRIRVSGTSSPVEPYFALGAGVRHLSVDEIAKPEVDTATDLAASLAAGVRVAVWRGLVMRAEVRDVSSFFESPTTGDSRLQNDIAVTVGLGTRLR